MDHYDIVIVGAGPVGLTLSTCLARWGYRIKHIDNRPEPTTSGRADGIQPRSLDLLQNMGLREKLFLHKPALVYQVAFWDPGSNGIERTGTSPSCPDSIDARYPFTALLHQGYIERAFLEEMDHYGVRVDRPWTIEGFEKDDRDAVHPIEVTLTNMSTNTQHKVRTKYLFSAEGARSKIREALGIKFQYKDPVSHLWGVMDGVVRTNFPDILMKCTIHSEAGSIMVIPRENNMVRLYIQLASSTDKDWDPHRAASEHEMIDHAQKILKPYWIEWESIDWFSCYLIGQGLAERYTLDNRVFAGGDACHTHSPKAGQGMNTAFMDGANLAWKLHHVESGFANRDILSTYESERREVADELLNFDAKYAKLFSQNAPAKMQEVSKNNKKPPEDSHNQEESEFVKVFKDNCEFTSGYGVRYQPNIFNWSLQHRARSKELLQGTKLKPGHLFPNTNVRRIADANDVHLEQEVDFNGAFRIFVFAGKLEKTRDTLSDFATALQHPRSFYSAYQRDANDQASFHERQLPHSRFFSICTIFAAQRSDIEISEDVPEPLRRYRLHVYADEIPDRRDSNLVHSAHAKMGFDVEKGGVVIVRPDGYVAAVVSLNGRKSVDALNGYFGSFCTKRLNGSGGQERARL